MKPLLIVILSLSFAGTAFGQLTPMEYPDSGFTNKAEAKNEMKDSLKEGKWVEYYLRGNDFSYPVPDYSIASYYYLTFYIKGKAVGIRRGYTIKGILTSKIHFTNGKPDGVGKEYYMDGRLKSEIIYTNDTIVTEKDYDENGNEIK